MYTHFYLYFDVNNRIIYRDSFCSNSLHQCYHQQMQFDITKIQHKLPQVVKAKAITILTKNLGANAEQHFAEADYCLACSEAGLTEAETDVMLELSHHKTNKEIAETLHLSEKTVETHLKTITKKLKVKGRSRLVAEIRRRADRYK